MSGEAVAHPLRTAAAPAAPRPRADLAWASGLVVLLALIVAARSAAIQAGVGDPIVLGFGFGLALLAVAVAARSRTTMLPSVRGLALRGRARAAVPRLLLGVAGGTALVVLALVGRTVAELPQLPSVFRGDLFWPWALATIIVAGGEEAVLRGALLDHLTRAAGLWPAILVTSLVFALIHIPFYGWGVVPLDLGVGIWLAGLRLASGGLLAPWLAHAVADLASWWL